MDNSLALLAIKALDGLTARATVTAQNIANANTRSYRPQRVSFEEALQQAASLGDDAIAAVQPKIEQVSGTGPQAELRLDLEAGTAAATAGRYSGVIEVLGRELQLQSLAITGSN
jgi:flagellar basal-body rod protein FlgB